MSSESLYIKCRTCGRSVFKSEAKCPQCGTSVAITQKIRPVWIIVGVLVLLVIIGSFGDENSTNNPVVTQSRVQPKPVEPPLELQSWRCGTEHGFIHVRGEVKNVSSTKLENVMVIGTFYTESGDFVKSESALIDYNPLLPGQLSAFGALGTENPAIVDCKISFKSLLGGSISYSTK
jgi:hypothetical protein